MEFVTLSKGDPEFEAHLQGTFSRTLRALPVETYRGLNAPERVTFKLLPVSEVKSPVWWKVYFYSTRPELTILTLAPAVAAWLSHRTSLHQWSKWPSWFALLGVFFLHTAAFLYNDVQDHLQGADRRNRRRGSQVIQKGWVTAQRLKIYAWINAGLAVLFGLPAFVNAPWQLSGICLLAVGSLLVLLQPVPKRWAAGDLALLLLFGPLLTMGTALASFAQTGWGDALLGLAFGSLSLWVFHGRQFENMFRALPEQGRSFLGFLPFETAKRVVIFEGCVVFILQGVLSFQVLRRLHLQGSPIWLLGIMGAFAPMFIVLWRLQGAGSPLSSTLIGISKGCLCGFATWTLWWWILLGSAWL